jgi:hypothetical protein
VEGLPSLSERVGGLTSPSKLHARHRDALGRRLFERFRAREQKASPLCPVTPRDRTGAFFLVWNRYHLGMLLPGCPLGVAAVLTGTAQADRRVTAALTRRLGAFLEDFRREQQADGVAVALNRFGLRHGFRTQPDLTVFHARSLETFLEVHQGMWDAWCWNDLEVLGTPEDQAAFPRLTWLRTGVPQRSIEATAETVWANIEADLGTAAWTTAPSGLHLALVRFAVALRLAESFRRGRYLAPKENDPLHLIELWFDRPEAAELGAAVTFGCHALAGEVDMAGPDQALARTAAAILTQGLRKLPGTWCEDCPEVEVLLSPPRPPAPENLAPALDAALEHWQGGLHAAADAPRIARIRATVQRALAPLATPEAALAGLDRLLERSPFKTMLLEHLIKRPRLLQVLVSLFAGAPDYANSLLADKDALERIWAGDFFGLPESPPVAPFEDDDAPVRRWRQGELRTVLQLLAVEMSLEEAGGELHRGLVELLTEVHAQTAGRGGPQTPAFEILLMGRLATGTAYPGSDADLIFLVPDENAANEGMLRATTAARRYLETFSRWRERWGGPELDVRLRPEGGSGPLIATWPRFLEYIADRAAAWELPALTRMRPLLEVCYSEEVQRGLTEALHRALCRVDLAGELRKMRQRLIAEKAPPREGAFHLKYGSGGFYDLEYLLRYRLLLNLEQVDPVGQAAPGNLARNLAQRGLLDVGATGELLEAAGRLERAAFLFRLSRPGAELLLEADRDFPLDRNLPLLARETSADVPSWADLRRAGALIHEQYRRTLDDGEKS